MSSTPINREQWKLMAVLSLFWGTLFGALGIFFPYYSLYLKEDLGLTGQQVGTAMGVFHLIGLIGQPAWGYIADRTGSRKRVLVILSTGMALGFVAFWFVEKYAMLLLVSAGFAAFSTSLIPQGMALGLGLLYRSNNSHFEWVRAFGSVGFLVTCFGFPYLLDAMKTESGGSNMGLLFPCSAAIILVHNHPSGDPSPSRADIEITKAIIDAGKGLGIAVHDHLIVGTSGHVSLRAKGLM